MPSVRVLRPFNNGSFRHRTRIGEILTVDDDRARELAANGLVEAVTAEKAAPPPLNKMQPALPNKMRGGAAAKGRR